MATTADRKKLRDAQRKPKQKTPKMPKDPKGVGAGFASWNKSAPGGPEQARSNYANFGRGTSRMIDRGPEQTEKRRTMSDNWLVGTSRVKEKTLKQKEADKTNGTSRTSVRNYNRKPKAGK